MHTHNTYNSILPKGVKRCTRLIPDIAHCHTPVSINSCPCILKIGYHFKSCCQTSPQTLLWLQGTTLLLILSSIFFWLPLRIHAVHYLSFTLGPFLMQPPRYTPLGQIHTLFMDTSSIQTQSFPLTSYNIAVSLGSTLPDQLNMHCNCDGQPRHPTMLTYIRAIQNATSGPEQELKPQNITGEMAARAPAKIQTRHPVLRLL